MQEGTPDPLVRWFAWVLRHRKAVLALVAAVTVASGLILTRVTIGSTLKKLFFGESPDYAAYLEQSERFGSDEHVMLGLEVDDPADPALIEKLTALDDAVVGLPGFERTASVATAQVIRGDDNGLTVVPWAEARRAGEASAEDAGGLLVGRDGKNVAVVVGLEVNPNRTAQEGLTNLQGLDGALSELGLDTGTVHRAGFPVLLVEMLHLAWDNLYRILPLSGVMLLVIVMAVFRRLLPAVVSVGIAGLAMVWTMAVSALIDPVFSIMVTAVPLVVVVVGFSDVIHLWSAWEQERLSGKTREQAILASAADVGRACLLTSITTFVGFVSLAFVPTPMFKQMGVSLGVGVALALVLAMTLVPILLSYGLDDAAIQRRLDGQEGTGGWSRFVGGLDRLLDGIIAVFAGWSVARPRLVVAVFFLLMGLAGVGAAQMNIDADLTARVAADHPVQQDARWFAHHFVGDNVVQVFLEGPEEGTFTDADRLAAVARFQEAVTALPEVEHTVSLVDALRRMHQSLGVGDGTTLPDSSAAVAQELLLFEMAGGEDLDRLIDFERQRLHIGVRLKSAGMRATRDTALHIEQLGAELLPSDVSVDASGLRVLMGAWIDRIIDGQTRGVGFSVAVVSLLMVVGLRSFRLGIVSMIPNLLPLLWLGGVLGFSWDIVDTDTAVIAMLAIGIGVDDTIHFLMRYRVEAARADREEAIARTFRFAGRAIVMTTVVLVVGFLPCALSDYFSLWILGTLLPMVLVFAVLADLLLVPAMVQLGWLAVPRPR